MSGNMSALNREISDNGRSLLPPRPPRTSSDLSNDRNTTSRNSFSFRDGGRSLSFTCENSPSFYHEDERRNMDTEIHCEKDVWSTRLILSGLEDIAFDDTSFPKLSPGVIHAFQKCLLAVNSATLTRNPFVEVERVTMGNSSNLSLSQSRSANGPASSVETDVKIQNEVMEELDSLPIDGKIVLKSLVSTYLRNLASKILEVWIPILEAEGITLPVSASSSSLSFEKKKGNASSEYDLKESLEIIINQLKKYQAQSSEYGKALRDLIRKRDEELEEFERDTKYYKRIAEECLKEESSQNNLDFFKTYYDYIEIEKKILMEKLRLEELKQDAEENLENEQKETEEVYVKVNELYEKMLSETNEMEERLQQYKTLPPNYTSILEEYLEKEEQIQTKEWVREQLQNGPKDDSLLNETF